MNLEADEIARSARTLRAAAGDAGVPPTAVLLGSGWGGLVDRVETGLTLDYTELPAFPSLSVGGHAGRLVMGRIGGRPVMVLAGRKHAYETGEPTAMKGVIRTLAAVGVQVVGQVMLLADHLNLVQRSPLVGEPGNARFVDMAEAYDPGLRDTARRVAEALGRPLREGIYAWLLGPQFETPAEIRMLQRLGADAVGMSTVPETILARHAGLKVLALSLITNMGCGLAAESLSHAHTLQVAQAAGGAAVDLLCAILPALDA
jgi:purine-nucleoside phosphorylase